MPTATSVSIPPPANPLAVSQERPDVPQVSPTGNIWLTILHNNDGESQLVNKGSGLENFGGVSRFAVLVQQERLQAQDNQGGMKRAVLMVSSGDNFLARPEFSASLEAGVFYDALAMDLIGYDAITLGNHDFDFGPDVLSGFIENVKRGKTPFLSSNLDFSGEPVLQELFDEGRIAESVVIEKNGQRFGIIGVTTPDLALRSSPRNVVVIADLAVEVQEEVDKLEADGVNKIILVSHLRQISDEIGLLATHIPS